MLERKVYLVKLEDGSSRLYDDRSRIAELSNHRVYSVTEFNVNEILAPKNSQTSQIKYKTWNASLIKTLTQEVFEVFPEEWDEWQHWICDIMEDRTRMQAKGINPRLVSLITFYRLTRFVWHIGIDKVFILATRRAKR